MIAHAADRAVLPMSVHVDRTCNTGQPGRVA